MRLRIDSYLVSGTASRMGSNNKFRMGLVRDTPNPIYTVMTHQGHETTRVSAPIHAATSPSHDGTRYTAAYDMD
jgi:hypothetical protein